MTVQSADVLTTVEPILARVLSLLEIDKVVVLIGGAQHSGKSWLARKLKEVLTLRGIPVKTLSNDMWLRGRNRPPIDETATGMAAVMADFDVVNFEEEVLRLIEGETITPPVYDIKTRLHIKDKGDPLSFREGVLIVDGGIILGMDMLREASSISIYVEVPDHIRLGRIFQCKLWFKKMKLEEVLRAIDSDMKVESKAAKALGEEFADIFYEPDPDKLPMVVICDH